MHGEMVRFSILLSCLWTSLDPYNELTVLENRPATSNNNVLRSVKCSEFERPRKDYPRIFCGWVGL